MTRIVLILLLILSQVKQAFACDPCALYSALNTNSNVENSLSLSVFEQLTSFEKGNSDAYYSLKNGERIKNFSTTQINLNYGLTNKFSLHLSVPFIVRDFDKVENFRSRSSRDSGIGDMTVFAQYLDTFNIGLGSKLVSGLYAGLKLPTGETGSIREENNLVKHHPISAGNTSGGGRILTFGSGSYDFPLGASFMLVKNRFNIPTGGQYTIRTEGSFDYRFANDLFWYVNPGYFIILDEDYSVSLNALLSGENKGADVRQGDRVDLSSFSNLFFGPSLAVTFQSNLGLEAAYQVRTTSKDNGIIAPEDRLRLAVSYRF